MNKIWIVDWTCWTTTGGSHDRPYQCNLRRLFQTEKAACQFVIDLKQAAELIGTEMYHYPLITECEVYE